MAGMINLIKQAFMSISERPHNFIFSAVWSFALTLAFLAIFMAFYFLFLLASFSTAQASAAANPMAFIGAIALMYGFIIAVALLMGPLYTVAGMLYAKSSLDGKDIGLGDFIPAAKEKYFRLLFANILLGLAYIVALILICLVLGGIGYAIYLIAGKALLPGTPSSYLLLAVAAIIAIAFLSVSLVALSLLASLYMPYVFSKPKLSKGLIGTLFYCIGLARSKARDIFVYMAVMFLLAIPLVILSIILSLIPVIGAIASMAVSFAISFASSYVLLYLVKDAP